MTVAKTQHPSITNQVGEGARIRAMDVDQSVDALGSPTVGVVGSVDTLGSLTVGVVRSVDALGSPTVGVARSVDAPESPTVGVAGVSTLLDRQRLAL
jgi:hypothetical protein